MKIYLIRHGEKEKDEFSSNLTPLGNEQIRRLAETLKNKSIKKIYSSSNPRSIQTGEIISNKINVPVNIINSIQELPREVFFQRNNEWSEENKQLVKNISLFLKEISTKNEDSILAMHAGINRATLSILLDIPLQKMVHFTQDIACVNVLEFKEMYGEKRWCVELLNSTHHLNE
ncbi:histidine phosphatase family protein [Candidatus Pacearchaeota archaeon]|nr:histidine phosphatase family protein [Candidatus Pacearchaeota archaeon]